jgi:3-dehydroquinate synthase
LLNFGHTFGHALETATDFGVNHGTAVVVGMLAAVALRAGLDGDDAAGAPLTQHCTELLADVPNLRATLERADMDRFLAAFLKDKKHPPDALRVVLPKRGEIGVEEVALPRSTATFDTVQDALRTACREVA